jgi:acetyl esterase/lipase
MKPRHLIRALALILSIVTSSASLAQTAPKPPVEQVPPGVRALRDLAYVANGHGRQKLDLFAPEKKPDVPLPVIVIVHGGGRGAGDKAQMFMPTLNLVLRGYAVARINYRLSGHAPFPAQIEDCKATVRWLRAHAADYDLDPQHFAASSR